TRVPAALTDAVTAGTVRSSSRSRLLPRKSVGDGYMVDPGLKKWAGEQLARRWMAADEVIFQGTGKTTARCSPSPSGSEGLCFGPRFRSGSDCNTATSRDITASEGLSGCRRQGAG